MEEVEQDKILDFALYFETLTDKFKKEPHEISKIFFNQNFVMLLLTCIRQIEITSSKCILEVFSDFTKNPEQLTEREILNIIFTFSIEYCKNLLKYHYKKKYNILVY